MAYTEHFYLVTIIGDGSGSDPRRPDLPSGVEPASSSFVGHDAGSDQMLLLVRGPRELHAQFIDAALPNGTRAWAAQLLSTRGRISGSVLVITSPSSGGPSPFG